jgi:hypothetical protein
VKTFWRGISKVLFYVIIGALLIYSSSRSLDFIQSTLPSDQQIVGFLGLAATSGGMLTWLLLFMYHSEGLGQKVTAGLMVVIDMVGEFGLFTMDTLYRSAQSGMISSLSADEIRSVILGLSTLIAVNIFSTVAYHLLDSTNIRNMREAFVRDQLEAKALQEIEKRGEQLAQQLAPQLAAQWIEEFEQRFSDFRALGFGSSMKPSAGDDKPAAKQDKPVSFVPHPVVPPQNSTPVMAPPDAVVRGNGHNGDKPDPL